MEGPSWKWREHNIAASLDCPPVHSALNCTSYSSDLPPLPHAPFLLSVTEASEDICKICFDRKIDTVILECGHRVVCSICAEGLPLPRLCPLCRSPIVRSYDKLHTQTHYLEQLKHLMDN